jgi:hypothetical protein
VIFSAHDLTGALAQDALRHLPDPGHRAATQSTSTPSRLAVNIAMYVLCSNYKGDQVHAPF